VKLIAVLLILALDAVLDVGFGD